MLIIQYEMYNKLTYKDTCGVTFCGKFRDMEHFKQFKEIEKTYNRHIRNVKILKEVN